MTDVCGHGSLMRSCELCYLEGEVRRLQQCIIDYGDRNVIEAARDSGLLDGEDPDEGR
jgi:hypothetical protein